MSDGRNRLDDVGKPGRPGVEGLNIIRLLEEKGIGDTELARRSGLPRSTITSLVSGAVRTATRPTLVALAKGFAVPLEELTEERAGTSEVEAVIREFRRSPEALTLDPPFGDADEARMRAKGKYAWTGSRPKPSALKLLVRFLRLQAGTEDRSV